MSAPRHIEESIVDMSHSLAYAEMRLNPLFVLQGDEERRGLFHSLINY